jgi:hypothetical protein
LRRSKFRDGKASNGDEGKCSKRMHHELILDYCGSLSVYTVCTDISRYID